MLSTASPSMFVSSEYCQCNMDSVMYTEEAGENPNFGYVSTVANYLNV